MFDDSFDINAPGAQEAVLVHALLMAIFSCIVETRHLFQNLCRELRNMTNKEMDDLLIDYSSGQPEIYCFAEEMQRL